LNNFYYFLVTVFFVEAFFTVGFLTAATFLATGFLAATFLAGASDLEVSVLAFTLAFAAFSKIFSTTI